MLVAGRNVSSDFMGQSGIRLVLECLNMGQAAGTAAAMSLKDGVTARQLDVQKLRCRLDEMGINLFREPEYGQCYIAVSTKITSEDLLYPEQNRSGQASVILTDEARKKYAMNIAEIEEDRMEKYLSANGYAQTGGDVGTNLE